MVDENILNYIKENSSMYSRESIEKSLMNSGKSKSEIDEVYLQFESMANSNQGQVNSNQINSNDFEYASIGSRFWAIILDTFIIFIPLGILSYFMPLLSFITYIIFPIYEIVMIGTSGSTIGKKMLGIKVVGEDGKIIGIGSSFFRYIMKIVSGIILYIGFFMAIGHPKKQTLHDRVVKTYVIKIK